MGRKESSKNTYVPGLSRGLRVLPPRRVEGYDKERRTKVMVEEVTHTSTIKYLHPVNGSVQLVTRNL